jgi:hypothetical protein
MFTKTNKQPARTHMSYLYMHYIHTYVLPTQSYMHLTHENV